MTTTGDRDNEDAGENSSQGRGVTPELQTLEPAAAVQLLTADLSLTQPQLDTAMVIQAVAVLHHLFLCQFRL